MLYSSTITRSGSAIDTGLRLDAQHDPSVDVGADNGAIRKLHDLGQRLWLDRTGGGQGGGALAEHIETRSITGITSQASPDAFLTNPSLSELRRAADQLRPIFAASDGQDGWVSTTVSPLLADDTNGTFDAAQCVFSQAECPNLLIGIPGTPAGLAAIEDCLVEGIPVNVTMLFSREQYLAAAGAYYRGITRRLRLGLHPQVPSVASVFVNPWDIAIHSDHSPHLQQSLGLAMCSRIYHTYRDVLASRRWSELTDSGACSQRLLWASTDFHGDAPDGYYIEALAAPDTIVAVTEKTLLALAGRGNISGVMEPDRLPAEVLLSELSATGVDLTALAARLQRDCVQSFVNSWHS